MVMSSFNVFNGVPVTVNKYLLRDVLRDELGFKGVVISDYTSSGETMAHKVCLTEKEVATKSILAGLDHEMISPTYAKYLEELVLEGEVSEKLIDEACLRILKLNRLLKLGRLVKISVLFARFKDIPDNESLSLNTFWPSKK